MSEEEPTNDGIDFDSMSEAYMEQEFSPISNIYYDMDLLQDFRLGAVLCSINTELEYEYLVKKLPDYNNRYDNATIKYFSALPDIDDIFMDNYLCDPEHHHVLAAMSPWTALMNDQFSYLKNIVETNNRCQASQVVTVHLGLGDVGYSEPLRENLSHSFYNISPNIRLEFHDNTIMYLDKRIMDNMDVIMVSDINAFMNAPNAKAWITEEGFFDKSIMAPKIVTEKITEDVEQVLEKTLVVLRAYFQFTYIKRESILQPALA